MAGAVLSLVAAGGGILTGRCAALSAGAVVPKYCGGPLVRHHSHFPHKVQEGALELSKVIRSCIVIGEWYKIECAVRADGTSPAREFLNLVKTGMWEADPEVHDLPDDEQVRDYHRLINSMRYLATHGEPEHDNDVNDLEDGLWEFKCYTKRLVFYDTDGYGGYEPKLRIQERARSEYPELESWWFPKFDYTLRLANSWPKVGPVADPLDIQEAIRIREEDLKHDR